MTKICLIATDAAPLLALAVADELDALLMPDVRVLVPDMVRHELVHLIEKPGSQEVLDWIRAHATREVCVVCTEEYEESIVLQRLARGPTRRHSEQAALEVLARELATGIDGAILLSDDAVFKQAHLIVRLPEHVLVLSTAAYLKRLTIAPNVSALLQRYMTAGRPWG